MILDTGAHENLDEVNGTAVVNHLPSEEISLPETDAVSAISFNQSSSDLPSLIDHCLTDSVITEIGMISSPRQVESIDDDIRSAMSTPPLQTDVDSAIVLPAAERYANGVFPDKIDNLFASQSPSNNQLLLDNLLSESSQPAKCLITDAIISEQLDKDVNSLLHLREGEAMKNDKEKISCDEIQCLRVDETVATSCNCDTVLPDVAESTKDDRCIVGACETESKMASDSDVNLTLVDSMSADANGSQNCDTASAVPFSLQECSAEMSSDYDKEMVIAPLFIVPCEEMIAASLHESELPAVDSMAERINWSCDVGKSSPGAEGIEPVEKSDMPRDSSETDADLILNSSVMCGDERTTEPSSVANSVDEVNVSKSEVIPWHLLSDAISKTEDTTNVASDDDFGLFPIITRTESVTAAEDTVSSISFQGTPGNGTFGSFTPSNVKGISPVVASFSSSSSDDESFDEACLPDWKLQTNAVVRLRRIVLPDRYYSPPPKHAVTGVDTAMSIKSETPSPSKLTSVQPLLSRMTSDSDEDESKSLSTYLPVKAPPDLSERSSFSALLADFPEKQPEERNEKNELPSVATDIQMSSSSTSTLSSSDVSSPSLQENSSFAQYRNDPKFQPVVRLVRLPLEFFRMLQQTSQPLASSSISLSDIQKRFGYSAILRVYITCCIDRQ